MGRGVGESSFHVFSSIVVVIINLFFFDTIVNHLVTPVYLLTVPGLVYVRFMNIDDKVSSFSLAVTISFIINSFVAMSMIYLDFWNPIAGFYIVIFIVILGVGMFKFQKGR